LEQPFLFGGGGGGSGGGGVSSSEDSSKFSSSSLLSSFDSSRSYDPLKDSSLSTFQCWVDIRAALATPLPLAGELSLGRFLLGARIFLLLFFDRVESDDEDEDEDEDDDGMGRAAEELPCGPAVKEDDFFGCGHPQLGQNKCAGSLVCPPWHNHAIVNEEVCGLCCSSCLATF